MQPTLKALMFRPTMLLSELNRTNWISNGTLRNTSSTQASGRLSRGNRARSNPNNSPAMEPRMIAQNVNCSVTQAPSSRNNRSLEENSVENMDSSSVTEQPPGHQPGCRDDRLGNQVIQHCCDGEVFEGAEGLDVVFLSHSGQVIVKADDDPQRCHQHRPHHLIGERIEDDS